MRRGLSPKEAVDDAIGRIRARHPTFQGALLALDREGRHAGATNCMDFHYSVASVSISSSSSSLVLTLTLPCFDFSLSIHLRPTILTWT